MKFGVWFTLTFGGGVLADLCDKKAFKPSVTAIKAKYYELFRGKGGEGEGNEMGGDA